MLRSLDNLIGERRVRSHNKTLGWLGSSSAAGVFDSNGRDQGTIPDIVGVA